MAINTIEAEANINHNTNGFRIEFWETKVEKKRVLNVNQIKAKCEN